MASDFMAALYEAAVRAADSEAGRAELTGMNRDHFVQAVKLVTDALTGMPPQTSLHVLLFAITYMRNALVFTMRENEARMHKQGMGGEG